MDNRKILENRVKYLAALRSGKYRQGRGRLRRGDTFCCLGVACDMLAPERWVDVHGDWRFDAEGAYLSEDIMCSLGLNGKDPYMRDEPASIWNDERGATFAEIADMFEELWGGTEAVKSWKVETAVDDTDTWFGNKIRLPTKQAAIDYAAEIYLRGTNVYKTRVVECEDPITHTFVNRLREVS